MDSEKCPRGISCLPLDICNLPKILHGSSMLSTQYLGGKVWIMNVLALLRPSLELLCHISYLFQRPVPTPSSTFSRGVSLERSLSGFSSLHVIWQERVSKLGPVQSQSIKNFKFILIDPKGFNSETDRSDMALWNLLSSEGKTKHRTMKGNECILLSGPSYLD